MRAAEWREFVADVRERGILEPLHLAPDGKTVIDGRHRLRAATELGMAKVPIRAAQLGTISAFDYAVRAATLRRQLSDDQRSMVAASVREELSREAKQQRAVKGGKSGGRGRARREGFDSLPRASSDKQSADTRDIAARSFGISRSKLEKAIALSKGNPTLAAKVSSGKLALGTAFAAHTKERARAELVAATTGKLPEHVELILGDFHEVMPKMKAASVDLVFTDPPYAKSDLHLWEALAQGARRVLKPGGFLVAYSGQANLDKVFEAVGRELDYFWTFAARYSRGYPLRPVGSRSVWNSWKPVIAWSNGKPSKISQFNDFLETTKSMSESKSLHPWAQPPEEARRIVELFCPLNGLTLDPMCGSGTIPAAASVTGRSAVGIEIDRGHYRVVKARLAGTRCGASRN